MAVEFKSGLWFNWDAPGSSGMRDPDVANYSVTREDITVKGFSWPFKCWLPEITQLNFSFLLQMVLPVCERLLKLAS